jgi:tetratricopeptide (TPR) repeat protein
MIKYIVRMRLVTQFAARIISLLLFFIFTALPTAALPFPRIDSDSFVERIGGFAEPLPLDLLIDAALYVSGAQPAQAQRAKERLLVHLESAKEKLGTIADEYERGEELLQFLHESIFNSYMELETRVDVTLETGIYNCVSSAVLYMIFARYLQLNVTAVVTPDHAFCTLDLPEGNIDIETTSVFGFDPGRKVEFSDSFGNVTGYSYVPPGNYRLRSDIGEKELLAIILQNRISAFEEILRFTEAVPLSVDRYFLIRDEESRKHMIREFINFAAQLNELNQYETAITFLNQTQELHGDDVEYDNIFPILYYNLIVSLINEGKDEEAQALLESAQQNQKINPSQYTQLTETLTRRLLSNAIPNLSFLQARELLLDLRERGVLAESLFISYIISVYGEKANAIAEAGEFLEAAALMDSAMELTGTDARLNRAKDVYIYNYTAEIHNEFALFFNAGDYEKAAAVLAEALIIVPDSKMLKNDLSDVKKILQSD